MSSGPSFHNSSIRCAAGTDCSHTISKVDVRYSAYVGSSLQSATTGVSIERLRTSTLIVLMLSLSVPHQHKYSLILGDVAHICTDIQKLSHLINIRILEIRNAPHAPSFLNKHFDFLAEG